VSGANLCGNDCYFDIEFGDTNGKSINEFSHRF